MTQPILISNTPLDVNLLIIDPQNNSIAYIFDEQAADTENELISYYTKLLQWKFNITDLDMSKNLSIEHHRDSVHVVYTPKTAAHNQLMLQAVKKQGGLSEKNTQTCTQIIDRQKTKENNTSSKVSPQKINGWTITVSNVNFDLPNPINVVHSDYDQKALLNKALKSELDKLTPDLELIRQLLIKGADCHVQGVKTGKTIAHIAAQNNDVEMLNHLRRMGARFDLCTTDRGESPLCYARTIAAAQELIGGNASLLQKNKNGVPVFEAMNKRATFPYRLLLALELDKCEKADPAVIIALTQKCPGEEHQGYVTGWSPVHVAVANDNFELLNHLLALNESLTEEIHQTRQTPIFFAESTEMVDALLKQDPQLLNAKANKVSAARYLMDNGLVSTPIRLIVEMEKFNPSVDNIKAWLKEGKNALLPAMTLYNQFFKRCDPNEVKALKKVILQHAQKLKNESEAIQKLMIGCSARLVEGHRRQFLFTLKQWLKLEKMDKSEFFAEVNKLSMKPQILSKYFNPVFEQANTLFAKRQTNLDKLPNAEKYGAFFKGAHTTALPDVFLRQSKNEAYNTFLKELMQQQKSDSPHLKAV